MGNFLNQNWLAETNEGFGIAVKIRKKLEHIKSDFQEIEVYDTVNLGKMLVLDGVIQLTEFDEFGYQEMMAHVPLFSHPDPKKVLVIGGGDGGVLREIAKHDGVESIDICEIDAMVIELSKKYLNSLSCGYDDPRVKVHVADGSEFVKERQQFYDVIIVDSSDPIGPGESLFNETFYRGMRNALAPQGLIASQSESIFLHMSTIKHLLAISSKLFNDSGYGMFQVPTYPTGTIGCCVATLGPDFRNPLRRPDETMLNKLKYYTHEIHKSCFALPNFVLKILQQQDK
ncbi:MAG: polyamine aminopropyltransferase [Victivallaceae bacterium]|jgi:spermidine synthase|nr:polyamine aminopropyltransferase [Victivallaceae bacterium]MDD3115901.1 polyamine aminopropyltransferase [Victivallaceae bacterium]MDD3703341.1 polyamine aminopropyltransferase [Victivallaceae bacterium]MDD4317024.1 polyamine aminopropyltransferase [Victivallaceae bacterium]MDD5663477.1 polyamine aminopropyltransferase [Victivallaceae bacterium]